MLAFVVLLLAVASRILPVALHAPAWNFTALGGGLLFFGSRMGAGSPRAAAAKLAGALGALIATDYLLTVYGYGYAFHVSAYLVTWLWYAAVCLLGMGLLEKVSVLRVGLGAFATSTSFFLLSNFAFWASPVARDMYPRTLSGLATCYTAGLPFYRNDLVSTALTAGVLFALPVVAAKIAESFHAAHNTPVA